MNEKTFNAVYELNSISDTRNKIKRYHKGSSCQYPCDSNKSNKWYATGCETVDGNVIPLYVKSPINVYLNGVSWYNENSVWKIGLDFSKYKDCIKIYIALGKEERWYIYTKC